jgi:dipeptidyl aminopeptidase/acylaminoacyl peptidase
MKNRAVGLRSAGRQLGALPGILACLTGMVLLACGGAFADPPQTLAEARQQFSTNLISQVKNSDPVPTPPAGVLSVVQYDSPVGPLNAYVTPSPGDGVAHPAIVWCHGGDCNTIGDVWSPQPADNDQSAAAYRQAGIIVMYPSLRGGNQNPGSEEKYYGEVDDVVAAGHYLASLPYVDSNRVYLGGHSNGATLALLVSEYTDQFRCVFSLDPISYLGPGGVYMSNAPFDKINKTEFDLRSPILWLAGIKSPTFVFSGTGSPSNQDSFQALAQAQNSPATHYLLVPGATHFTLVGPANQVIAQKILQDTAATPNIQFTNDDIAAIAPH